MRLHRASAEDRAGQPRGQLEALVDRRAEAGDGDHGRDGRSQGNSLRPQSTNPALISYFDDALLLPEREGAIAAVAALLARVAVCATPRAPTAP